MRKVTVIGSGNVGATVANVLAHKDLVNEIVLLDIQGDMAKGKALDMWQQAPVDYYSTKITGTDDYAKTADSDIVVITAGIPRKPGMSRDDLISTNANIVSSVTAQIMKYSANPIIIVVSNPLDVMTYAAWKTSGLPSSRVFGMAGILDTGRFKCFLSEALNVSVEDIQSFVLGGHGDTMVPMPRYTTISGIPLSYFVEKGWISNEKLDAIIDRTRNGGAEIVNYLKTGSAFYAPATSALQIAESYLFNQRRILPCAAYLQGEYGINNVYAGVPVIIGKNGVEKVIEVPLDASEKLQLQSSVESVKSLIQACLDLGL